MINERNFFQIDEDGKAFLKREWQALIEQYNCDESRSERVYNLTAEKYSNKDRAYHNLSHIEAILKSANSLQNKIRDFNAVCFAIWFHDVIYNTNKGDNEEKSSEFAAEMMLELKVPQETIGIVQSMILATKEHSVKDDSVDTRIFLDLDLSILGTREELYKEYSRAIRKEYSWVPNFMYRRGRKKVLNNFLARERIYFTDELAARLESQARYNIENEIKTL
jgi:predicted metal-dependent HD superfamily phosphohydrolase